MTYLMTHVNDAPDPLKQHFSVDLTRMEMALIIEALLQAEKTLPLLDHRYAALKPLEGLRYQQMSLANRLEDIMAGPDRWHDGNGQDGNGLDGNGHDGNGHDGASLHPAWASHWRRTQP